MSLPAAATPAAVTPPSAAPNAATAAEAGGSPLAFLFAALLPAATPVAVAAAAPAAPQPVAETVPSESDTDAAAAQFIDLLLPPATATTVVPDAAMAANDSAIDGEATDTLLDATPVDPVIEPMPPLLPVTSVPALPLPEEMPAPAPTAVAPPPLPKAHTPAPPSSTTPASTVDASTAMPIETAAADAAPTIKPWLQADAEPAQPRFELQTSATPATHSQPHGLSAPGTSSTAAASPPPAAMPAAPSVPLDTTAHDWSAALGEHIAWSVEQGDGEAQVELHPAELGSLTIRVTTQGDQARVSIVAADAAARELLQQSLPQLRELMTAQGLNLAKAQVERPSPRGQGDTGSGRQPDTAMPARRRITQVMLVDAYA